MALIRIFISGATSILCLCACEAPRALNKSPKLEEVDCKVKVILPAKDLWAGRLIFRDDVIEYSTPGAKVPANHLGSIDEAVGKVPRIDLPAGTIICRDQLSAPTQPKLGETWLLYFSKYELSKRVGTIIAVKGFLTDWIIGGEHKDNECQILASDGVTGVRIGLPCAGSHFKFSPEQQRIASAQRASWLHNSGFRNVILARGVLRRCSTKSSKGRSSRDFFLLDQRTLMITKSSWCN